MPFDDVIPMDDDGSAMRCNLKIFIGGVPMWANAMMVSSIVAKYCNHSHVVRLAEAPKEFNGNGERFEFGSTRHSGHGVVTFEDEEDRQRIIKTKYLSLKGELIEVKPYAKRRFGVNPSYTAYKLFVAIKSKGKPATYDLIGQEEHLKQHFSHYGPVHHVNISSKPGEHAFAFIVFRTPDGPQNALKARFHHITREDGEVYTLVCKEYNPRDNGVEKKKNITIASIPERRSFCSNDTICSYETAAPISKCGSMDTSKTSADAGDNLSVIPMTRDSRSQDFQSSGPEPFMQHPMRENEPQPLLQQQLQQQGQLLQQQQLLQQNLHQQQLQHQQQKMQHLQQQMQQQEQQQMQEQQHLQQQHLQQQMQQQEQQQGQILQQQMQQQMQQQHQQLLHQHQQSPPSQPQQQQQEQCCCSHWNPQLLYNHPIPPGSPMPQNSLHGPVHGHSYFILQPPSESFHDAPPPTFYDAPWPFFHDAPSPTFHDAPSPTFHEAKSGDSTPEFIPVSGGTNKLEFWEELSQQWHDRAEKLGPPSFVKILASDGKSTRQVMIRRDSHPHCKLNT